MKKVLVAVDGSGNASRAVAWLVDLCRSHGPVEIRLLNVEPQPQAWQTHGMEPEAVADHLRARCSLAIEESSAPLREAGLAFEGMCEFGDASHVIAEVAMRTGCDTILIGRRGLGSIRGMALGSVSSRLLHLTDLPVVLVK